MFIGLLLIGCLAAYVFVVIPPVAAYIVYKGIRRVRPEANALRITLIGAFLAGFMALFLFWQRTYSPLAAIAISLIMSLFMTGIILILYKGMLAGGRFFKVLWGSVIVVPLLLLAFLIVSSTVMEQNRFAAEAAEDAETVEPQRTLRGHTQAVQSITWSPDGARLASGSDDGTVIVWDVATGEQLLIRNFGEAIVDVAWSPDGTAIASGPHDDGTLIVWDVVTEEQMLEKDALGMTALAWSPDGTMLAVRSLGTVDVGPLVVWDVVTGEALAGFEGDMYAQAPLVWSPDGTMLATGSLELWKADSGNLRRVLQPDGSVGGLAWSPDGRRLVSVSKLPGSPRSLIVWDANSGKRIRSRAGSLAFGVNIDWSPDGRQFAAATSNRARVIVFHAGFFEPQLSLEGHSGAIRDLAYSPDGTTFATASEDGTVKLWKTGL